jgi:hypothetical protein
MGNGNGVSRGDRNRNARLDRLRALVPVSNAIVGIDLADCKQMVVVTDHDSKVLARKTYRCRVWDLGAALDWACERAACDARTRDYVRGLVAPELGDLRPAKNITLTAAARAMNTYPNKLLRTETRHLPRLRPRRALPRMAQSGLSTPNKGW